MIKVLVVEDSPVIREFLVHILSSDPEIQVIGTANDGKQAVELLNRSKPDVISMDLHMPGMDGLEATRRIMQTTPVPIIIVSGSWDPGELAATFRAIEAGALAVIQRPAGIGHPDHEATAKQFVETIKLMSEVKVVRRWASLRRKNYVAAAPSRLEAEIKTTAEIKVVAMGASTGGPLILQTILSGLLKDFPAPVLIVQHMAPGFIQGFAEWLKQSCAIPVSLASDGEPLLPGHVYVAPDGFHMGVKTGDRIALSKDEPENGLRPSVSYLFRSVADVYGPNAVGVLLTGMGKDGAEELKLMKESGAVTIVQDEESSVVYGMPGEAMKLNAATYVLRPDRIAAVLNALAKNERPT